MARRTLAAGTTRIALVAADRHRARVISSGRFHPLPSVRSVRQRGQADRQPPVLVPPGRIRTGPRAQGVRWSV